MNPRILVLIIICSISVFMEYYFYNGFKTVFVNSKFESVYKWVYMLTLALTVSSVTALIYSFSTYNSSGMPAQWINILVGVGFGFFISKLLLSGFWLLEDVYRAGEFIVSKLFSNNSEPVELASRRKFITTLGLGVAAIPFLSFLHGSTKGKYLYTVNRIKLKFKDLPKNFEGYKIVQFTDFHAGSFDSIAQVIKGFELINNQEADLILFTGDMVNNRSSEFEPFIEHMSKLKAKDGQYAILGNHDYGDYMQWPNGYEKQQNLLRLKKYEQDANMRLLLNENVRIQKGDESIVLAGVENWGLPPFPQHGDLEQSLQGVHKDDFLILMSHDPSHWRAEVLKHLKKVHLTLSGHTHGMQFGIDIPWLKWSPVKMKYPEWAGLYTEQNQHLYVNKGFGFIGFPGRVGMWPEISVFELSQG